MKFREDESTDGGGWELPVRVKDKDEIWDNWPETADTDNIDQNQETGDQYEDYEDDLEVLEQKSKEREKIEQTVELLVGISAALLAIASQEELGSLLSLSIPVFHTIVFGALKPAIENAKNQEEVTKGLVNSLLKSAVVPFTIIAGAAIKEDPSFFTENIPNAFADVKAFFVQIDQMLGISTKVVQSYENHPFKTVTGGIGTPVAITALIAKHKDVAQGVSTAYQFAKQFSPRSPIKLQKPKFKGVKSPVRVETQPMFDTDTEVKGPLKFQWPWKRRENNGLEDET